MPGLLALSLGILVCDCSAAHSEGPASVKPSPSAQTPAQRTPGPPIAAGTYLPSPAAHPRYSHSIPHVLRRLPAGGRPVRQPRWVTKLAGVIPPSAGGVNGTLGVTMRRMDRGPKVLSYSAPTVPRNENRIDGLSDLDGDVVWSDPPAGVVDARQPHGIEPGAQPQGIQAIFIYTSEGADMESGAGLSFCLAGIGSPANDIGRIATLESGSYALDLDHPITPGGLIEIVYQSGSAGMTATGRYGALPGDANADRLRGPDDLTALINCCLAGACEPAFGHYSCDINRSGTVDAEDLLRLADVLACASAYDSAPWCDAELPEGCQ